MEKMGVPKIEKESDPSHEQLKKIIEDFEKSSRNERETLPNGKEQITTPEGETYFISLLTDPTGPLVEKSYQMILDEFGEDEAGSLTWFRHGIEARLYEYFVIENAEGEVVGFSQTQLMDLPKSGGKDETMMAVWYVLNDPSIRKLGLGREVYRNVYSDILKRVSKDGKVFKGNIGETVDSAEAFVNRLGKKKLYFETLNGDIHEVPYACPPIDFDQDTGKPLAPSIPEHLTLSLTSGKETLSTEELLPLLETMYAQYLGAREDYHSDGAYAAAQEEMKKLLEPIRSALTQAKGNEVFMMSKEERAKRKAELEGVGRSLVEIVKEDEQEEDSG